MDKKKKELVMFGVMGVIDLKGRVHYFNMNPIEELFGKKGGE